MMDTGFCLAVHLPLVQFIGDTSILTFTEALEQLYCKSRTIIMALV